jgi:hypothetical protein
VVYKVLRELWGFIEILVKTERKPSKCHPKNSSAISQLTFQPNEPIFDNFQ